MHWRRFHGELFANPWLPNGKYGHPKRGEYQVNQDKAPERVQEPKLLTRLGYFQNYLQFEYSNHVLKYEHHQIQKSVHIEGEQEKHELSQP